MKKYDFLPNRQNKYSIRKFTVGTASILLGTMMLLGAQDEAKAAEDTSETTTTNESTTEPAKPMNSKDNGEATGSDKDVQLNQPNGSFEDVDSEEDNGNTTNSVAKEDSETSTPDQESQSKQTDENVADENNEKDFETNTKNNDVPTERKSENAINDSESQEEDKTLDSESDNNKVETKNENSTKNNHQEQNKYLTKDTSEQKGNQNEIRNEESSKEDKTLVAPKADDTSDLNNNKTKTLSPITEKDEASNKGTQAESKLTAAEPEELGSNASDDLNAQLDTSSESDSQAELTDDSLNQSALFRALQQSSDNKDKYTIETTAETTPTQPRIASYALTANDAVTTLAAQGGKDVADLVTVSNMNAVPMQSNDKPRTVTYQDTNITRPELFVTSGDRIQFTGDYAVDDNVHEGDYFTLQYGEYFRPGSIETPPAVTNLVDSSGKLVASGVYDQNTNSTKYTFTNYVDQYSNITGSFNFSASPNRTKATTDKEAYPFEVTMAGEKYTNNIVVDYGNKNGQSKTASGALEGAKLNINAVNEYDTDTHEYKMVSYVNQANKKINNAVYRVDLQGMTELNDVEIYRVQGNSRLKDSFVPDLSGLTPVNKNITYNDDKTSMTIDLGNIAENERYIILYSGTKDDNASGSRGANSVLTGVMNNSQFSDANNVVIGSYMESSIAKGELHSLGDYVWFDENHNGLQDEGEKPASGVTVYLYDSNNIRKTTTTDSNGHYQFDDLKNGTYTIEFVPPEGYTATITDANNNQNDDIDSDGLIVEATINGADDFTYDLGLVKEEEPTYTLGDYVWEDTNKDGIQNPNEPGIGGVKVTLTKPDGTTEETTTDENGNYEFTGLENGDYT